MQKHILRLLAAVLTLLLVLSVLPAAALADTIPAPDWNEYWNANKERILQEVTITCPVHPGAVITYSVNDCIYEYTSVVSDKAYINFRFDGGVLCNNKKVFLTSTGKASVVLVYNHYTNSWGTLLGDSLETTCTAEYEVTFQDVLINADGSASAFPGTPSSGPQTATSGSNVNISSLLTRDGYISHSWTANSVTPLDGVSFQMPNGPVTVTLNWCADANNNGIPDFNTRGVNVQVEWEDENNPMRPGSQEIQVLDADGNVYASGTATKDGGWKTVLLVQDSWSGLTVTGVQPQFYTTSSAQLGAGELITISNTRIKTVADPEDVLQTGQLTWPVMVLAFGGLSLFTLGAFLAAERRRGRYER